MLIKDRLNMIKELMNLIKSYLDGDEIIISEGYQNITRKYNFYHVLEDYLPDNWDYVVADDDCMYYDSNGENWYTEKGHYVQSLYDKILDWKYADEDEEELMEIFI